MFTCQQLSKTFGSGHNSVPALADLNFQVADQEFVCVVGPSGCGKSSLLRLIAGLLEPSTGQIFFSASVKSDQPRSALVFQDAGLFPWLTVLDNLAFGLETQGVRPTARRQQAEQMLVKLGLAGFAERYPHELSGGMRQRVGIGRAFLADPALLLMDEPLGALDAQTRLRLQDELLQIWQARQKTVLYVTHDIEEAIRLGDRILVMSGRPGRLIAEVAVPLARPRPGLMETSVADQQIITEIRWHIWKMLAAEVAPSLHTN
ncbi:MAG: ABC transporter ATP-binding protein [Caldilineaceae bacterium]|nr:ABC transporter ATP-binding protein [Caldilineaceae bacterium]